MSAGIAPSWLDTGSHSAGSALQLGEEAGAFLALARTPASMTEAATAVEELMGAIGPACVGVFSTPFGIGAHVR